MKSRLLCTVLALAVPTFSASALFTPVATQINISIDLAPPAPRYEVMPAHLVRAMSGRRATGTGTAANMPGCLAVGSRFARVTGSCPTVGSATTIMAASWRFVASRWDRDGDGIPNVVDLFDNQVLQWC